MPETVSEIQAKSHSEPESETANKKSEKILEYSILLKHNPKKMHQGSNNNNPNLCGWA